MIVKEFDKVRAVELLRMAAESLHYDQCALRPSPKRRLALVLLGHTSTVCTCDAFGVWHQIDDFLKANE